MRPRERTVPMTSPGLPTTPDPASAGPADVAAGQAAVGGASESRTVNREGTAAAQGGEQRLRISCVILTMGTRPAELRRAVNSVLEQEGADLELVVVSNGAELPELPDGVVTVELPENIGIPEGRNHEVK